ncbi:MAG: hypothetical protein NXI24_11050 [bacterium]|nr:hypothetical protein [bacterium]
MSDEWPPPIEEFLSHEINVALEMLFKENHDSIMKLRFKIPPPNVYPWEYFLRLNFSPDNPHMRPYVFEPDHFAKENGHLLDRAKPRTYYALFRFLEWFRESLEFLETSVDVVEAKFRHFKFRAKQQLENKQVDRKELDRNIQATLIQAHNMISQRGHVETSYKKALLFINTEIGQRGEFNLRKLYGSQTMESDLYPDFNVLTTQVFLIIQNRRRIEKILANWKHIRVPGMPRE